MKRCIQTLALAAALGGPVVAADDPLPARLTNAPTALPNVFRLTPRVLSGSQPEGEVAFAWLAAQGVKTLVSVDGARPDVEAARQHGLRYVHLPIRYDGMTSNRGAALVWLSAALPGPFYVHCHHGKHRGPAAAAILCEADAGWRPPPEHPDVAPPHEATQLWEQLRELGRTSEVQRESESYKELLRKSEAAADELRQTLRDTGPGASRSAVRADAALRQLTDLCTACHMEHRN